MSSCIKKFINCITCRKPQLPSSREIFVKNKWPSSEELTSPYEYVNNEITSSKYTAWNFIFVNLFEQFQRIANFYFILVMLVQLLIDSPVSAFTTVVPIVFVLAVTAIKQAIEDVMRHKSDNEVNERKIEVLIGSQFVETAASKIRVGDVVRITSGNTFPCDIVLLNSSDESGECTITTANLDGETSLKVQLSIDETRHIDFCSANHAPVKITCGQPIEDLYSFSGTLAIYPNDNIDALAIGDVKILPQSYTNGETSNSQLLAINDEKKTSPHFINQNNFNSPQLANNANNSLQLADKMANSLLPLVDKRTKNSQPLAFALSSKNLLLRAAMLRNTEFIIGVAVYTGSDTKLSLNSKRKAAKYSQVELRLNHYLITYFIILFAISLICLICLYVYQITQPSMQGAWYLPPKNNTAWQITQDFFGFIVIYNYLIPISLYVTIEIVKFAGGFFVRVDLDMYDPIGDNRAKANTSDLNEELGQITYLFSDKTGTLTENDMQFRRCSIDGIQYIDVDGALCKMSLADNSPDEQLVWPYTKAVTEFLIFLCVCHTVRVDRSASTPGNGNLGPLADKNMVSPDGLDYDYQAPSPDEKAFVEASRRYGVVYHGSMDGFHKVTVKGETQKFKVREVFEFDSDRKCMSVIVDYPDGTTKLLCKGAESSMLPKASRSAASVSSDILMDHLTSYAESGLRTLVFGYKDLSKSETESILRKISDCKKSLHDVELLLSNVFNEVETNLVLTGCTGIEDRLQDGVKETLEDIRSAGIKVWVLTGDKEETAVNISYSAGHFGPNMREMRLTKLNTLSEAKKALETQIERMETASTIEPNAAYCLIVDGKALQFMLEPVLEDEFIQLCMQVATVLCCRMTPIQKAEIVSMIKQNVKPEPVTCAIGDGGNDVSMIQEAHVGLGIFGKEGRQAVRAADYAIGKFRFCRRLLLVHGHYFYNRIGFLVQYFFYKNIVFIAPQFYFAFFNLFSAKPMYFFVILAIYNVTFTTLPIIIFGLFEQILSQTDLLSRPPLYKLNVGNALLETRKFVIWNINGLWHSLVIFFGPYLIATSNQSIGGSSGRENALMFFGHTVFSIVWIVVTAKLYLITFHFNNAVLIAFLIVLIGNVMVMLIMSYIISLPEFYYMLVELYSQPSFWLIIFIFSLIALTPDIIYKVYTDYVHSKFLKTPSVKRSVPKRRTSYIPSKLSYKPKLGIEDVGSKNVYENPAYE